MRNPWLPVLPFMLVSLSSCSLARNAVIRNASGSEIMLWPLGERPQLLGNGAITERIIYPVHLRQQALIQRGGCLYTYPAPDYFALPSRLRRASAPVAVEIREDMSLHIYERSQEGVESEEIIVAGFPLRPTAFCGGRT